jgi:hypothetical protein
MGGAVVGKSKRAIRIGQACRKEHGKTSRNRGLGKDKEEDRRGRGVGKDEGGQEEGKLVGRAKDLSKRGRECRKEHKR